MAKTRKSPSRARRAARVDREVPEAFADKLQALRAGDQRSFEEDLAQLGMAMRKLTDSVDDRRVIAQAAYLRAAGQVDKLDRVREMLLTVFSLPELQRVLEEVLGSAELTRLMTVTRDLTLDEWKPCPRGCGHLLIDHKTTGGCTKRRMQDPCSCPMEGFLGKTYDPLFKPPAWTAAALLKKKHRRKLDEFEKLAKAGNPDAQRLIDEVNVLRKRKPKSEFYEEVGGSR